MHIYLSCNPAKFHFDPICNDGVLVLFVARRPSIKNNKNNNSNKFLS